MTRVPAGSPACTEVGASRKYRHMLLQIGSPACLQEGPAGKTRILKKCRKYTILQHNIFFFLNKAQHFHLLHFNRRLRSSVRPNER